VGSAGVGRLVPVAVATRKQNNTLQRKRDRGANRETDDGQNRIGGTATCRCSIVAKFFDNERLEIKQAESCSARIERKSITYACRNIVSA
jgi:hypothetical protein